MDVTEVYSPSTGVVSVISRSHLLGKEIDVYGSVENPFFLAKDVADWLELANVSDMVSRVDSEERSKFNLGSRQGVAWFLSEYGLYEVFMQSRKPVAREFKTGVKKILHQLRTEGVVSAVPQQPVTPQPTLMDKIKTAKFLASFLCLNDTSKLALAKAIADPLGLPTPDYAKSKGVMHSATELLQRLGYKVTATAFNKLAAAKGFVSQMSRPGSKGNTHTWYAITDKGKTFGENVVSPKNAKQTQAHWYDDKFDELCALVGIRKEVAA